MCIQEAHGLLLRGVLRGCVRTMNSCCERWSSVCAQCWSTPSGEGSCAVDSTTFGKLAAFVDSQTHFTVRTWRHVVAETL